MIKIKSLFLDPENFIPILLGLILLITPLAYFGWNLGPQTLVHALILLTLMIALNFYCLPFRLHKEGVFLLFLIVSFISFIKSPEKATFRNEYLILLDAVFFSYIFGHISQKNKETLLHIPVLTGLFFTVIMLFYFISSPATYVFGEALPSVFILNHSITAGYLFLCFAVSFILWKENHITPYILSAGLFAGIILTQSRAAILVSTVAGSLFIFRSHKTLSRWLKLFIPLGIIMLLLFSYKKYEAYKFSAVFDIFDRFMWWQAAWNMFKDNLITGVGWGNFKNLFLLYKPYPGLNTVYAHNLFLQLLAETGLAGLASFTLILYMFFKFVKANFNTFIFPVFLAVTGLLFINILDYSFYVPAIMILFWALLGSIHSDVFKLRPKTLMPWLLTAVIFLIGSYFLIQPFLGSIYYNRGIASLNSNNLIVAGESFQDAVKTDPLSSLTYGKLAETYFKIYTMDKNDKYLDLAISYQEKAVDLFKQNPVFWSDLAWLYWTKNNKTEAVEAIKKAVFYDKFNAKYQDTLLKFTI